MKYAILDNIFLGCLQMVIEKWLYQINTKLFRTVVSVLTVYRL